MDNVLDTNGVPLTVFGGAVPELAPEDLPEGASPWNQDCDFNPGSVFTRAGRQNQYTYANFIVTDNPRLGQTLPGAFAPNETPWLTPSNITLDNPAFYASVPLNQSQNVTVIVQVQQIFSNALGNTFVGAFNAPVTAGNTVVIALFVHDPNVSGSEQPLITACVDQRGQTFEHVGNTFPAANYSANSLDAGQFAVQKSANGGGQTYTCTVKNFTGGGNIAASGFVMCLVEVTGTSNLSGADPLIQAFGSTAQAANANQTSTVTLTTVTNNCLILGIVSVNGNFAQSAYLVPGAAGGNPTAQNVLLAEQFITSGYYRDQCVVGKILLNPFSALVTYTSDGTPLSQPPWSSVSIVLQMAGVPLLGKPGITGAPDQFGGSSAGGVNTTTVTYPTVTSAKSEILYAITTIPTGGSTSVLGAGLGWLEAGFGIGSAGNWTQAVLQPGVPFTGSLTGIGPGVYATAVWTVPFSGGAPPAVVQDRNILSGAVGSGTPHLNNFTFALTPGNTIYVTFQCYAGVVPPSVTATNSVGDVFTTIATSSSTIPAGGNTSTFVLMAQNIVGGNTDITVAVFGAGSSANIAAIEIKAGAPFFAPQIHSQILQGSQYGPGSIPAADAVLGMEVLLAGHQSIISDPSVNLSITTNVPGSQTFTAQLPVSDGVVVVGNSTSQWGLQLTPAMINNPSFGIQVVANAPLFEAANFFVYGLQIKLFLTPNPPTNFNWIKTYEQTDAEIDTLALDAAGVLWDEDVDTNPTVLNSIFTTILPNTFAKSVTFNDIEYVAFSNLVNGTDVPRQWNGTNLDRISMVGPGAMPTAATTGGAGGNSTAIQNITQAPKTMLRRVAWGNSFNAINDSSPGITLVFYGEGRTFPPYTAPPGNLYQSLPPYTASFGVGTSVVITGVPVPFPKKGGGSINANINQSYNVLQVTMAVVGGAEQVPVFTVAAPFSAYGYSNDFGSAGPPPTSNWFYQSTLATVTMQAPLPNVGVGSNIAISGTGGGPPTGYDGNFTVLQAPNTCQMTVNSGQSVGNVATYSYTLIPPSVAPSVGQIVSIQNCIPTSLNTSSTGVAITAVSGGTFSVSLTGPDTTPPGPISQAGNNATATVAGTVFVFDPSQIVNSGNPVNGGTIVQQGQIAQGSRKVCYCFLTRSGYITQPSPIFPANITAGSGAITVTGLSVGPPNVVARIVCFTGANGANFFYIPQTVNVLVGGVLQVNTSTIVNDNVSTSAQFNFSDAVLLSATAIDIPGNNTFNTIELGSCRGLLNYSSRLFAWSEQTKITNLRNWSFDGGYGGATIQGANVSYPLGWSIDATNGGGGTLLQFSPVFGWCYQISNTSGSTQAVYGMLTQNAYQDEFGVAIVAASTLYSVRVTASVNPVPGSGNLVVDLYSPGRGVALGTFSIPLASMSVNMQIYSGTLLTSLLQPVPSDLVIRIWAQNMLTATTILVDRVEPFQTLTPVYTTALKASYVNNQEAFDLLTGICGPAQNQQPINGAMELFDLLYALKEKSWFSTSDNGVTEPNQWNWKEVSNKVGTIGIHSYDWGEGWALTGNRQGVYFFEGGEPIKVSQEIQPLWDLINWPYGYTMWVRNDPEQRRFTVGLPIATPNPYMPEFPVNANPTTPNVILMCNYRELNSGSALAATGPIRSTYTGRLMSPEPARKWSFWNFACPYSDYISRANNNWPQFFCTGYQDSKIFALAASLLSDDGNAINSFWISYGFVKPEMADAKGLGLYRMEFPYMTVLATGTGNLNCFVYPESPFNSPFVLDPLPLPAISQGDLEVGVNVKGNRFFVRVGTNQVGAAFRCSKLVVPLIADSWSPIRGFNAVKV